ncbi:hypothetical protein ABPG74_012807 [Tetrahymena malaccensis]
MNQLQSQPGSPEERLKKCKQIEILFLIIAWISAVCCLIRTDFNFAFALFGYYLWISRGDKANSMMLIIMNGVLVLVDIIWLIAVANVWTSTSDNKAWNSLHGLHVFALLLSILNVILKAVIIFLINSYKNGQNAENTKNMAG